MHDDGDHATHGLSMADFINAEQERKHRKEHSHAQILVDGRRVGLEVAETEVGEEGDEQETHGCGNADEGEHAHAVLVVEGQIISNLDKCI